MILNDDVLFSHAEAYCHSRRIQLLKQVKLGYGSDGTVWRTRSPSAVKAVNTARKYANELECYRRLKEAGCDLLCGFAIPRLVGFDNDLMVIEMGIVQPPFLLDFGKVALDAPPSYFFDRQRVAAAEAEGRELFGDRWPDVSYAMYALRTKFGIYYADPRPGNINLGYDPTEEGWDKEPEVDYSEYE